MSAAGPRDPEAVARSRLEAGERLLWAGVRASEARAGPARGRLVAGLALAVAALAFTLQALQERPWLAWAGLAFIALGGALAASPWVRRRRGPIVYAVSDRRLLIIDAGPRAGLRTIAPAEIETLERRQRGNGVGDLIVRRELIGGGLSPGPQDDEYARRRQARAQPIGFLGIRDLDRAEAAVRALLKRPPMT